MRGICAVCEYFEEDCVREDGFVFCASCISIHRRRKSMNKIIRQHFRSMILEYKLKHPCVSCGECEPKYLEFHHIDPSTKEYEVSRMAGFPDELILREINKCEIRCVDCHIEHHRNKKSPVPREQ